MVSGAAVELNIILNQDDIFTHILLSIHLQEKFFFSGRERYQV